MFAKKLASNIVAGTRNVGVSCKPTQSRFKKKKYGRQLQLGDGCRRQQKEAQS